MDEPDSLDTPALFDVAHGIGRIILAVVLAPIIAGPMLIYRVVHGFNEKDDPRYARRPGNPDDVSLAAAWEHPSIGTILAEVSKPMFLAAVVAFLLSPAGSSILLGVTLVLVVPLLVVAAVLSGPAFILFVVRSVNRAAEMQHVKRTPDLADPDQPLRRPEAANQTEIIAR